MDLNNNDDGRINFNAPLLTEKEKNICDASLSEIVLYYIFYPNVLIRDAFNFLTKMMWG